MTGSYSRGPGAKTLVGSGVKLPKNCLERKKKVQIHARNNHKNLSDF